jgi:hypothetical protein
MSISRTKYTIRVCRRIISILLAGSVVVGPALRAQVVETSSTTTAQTSTASTPQSEAVSGEGALIFSPAAAPLPADLTPTGGGLITGLFGPNKGPFQYAIHLTIRGAYDDNIGLTHTNPLHDRFVEIQPSVLLGLGDLVKQDTFLAAIYLPSFYRYDDHSQFDSDQHIAHFLGGISSGNLILRLSQDVAIRKNIVLAGTSAERSSLGTTTGRTDLNTYNTRLSLNYNMTPSDFIFSELIMNRTDYAAPLIDSELYAADLYLNHGFSQQLILGLGVVGGYNAVDFPTPDQSMVQANVHLNYTPNRQFSVDIIAGEEFRTFENNARGSYDTPVFVISAGFAPNDDIKFGLTATRQIYNSAAATAQDYVDTSVNGLMREHICKPLYFTLLGGYEHVEYFNAIDLPMPLPTLRDDYFYIQPAVDIVLTRFWIIGGYYLRRQNTGSVSTVDFHANEFGVRTTIKF